VITSFSLKEGEIAMTAGNMIGRKFGPYRSTVSRERLRLFAEATGETRLEYLDEEAARAAGMRDIPAPPTYLFCLQMLDAAESMDWGREIGLPLNRLLHAEQSFTYFEPICAGDAIECELEVVDRYEKKGGALVFVATLLTGRNEAGRVVAQARELLAYPNS
jgi:acyl dehydratase